MTAEEKIRILNFSYPLPFRLCRGGPSLGRRRYVLRVGLRSRASRSTDVLTLLTLSDGFLLLWVPKSGSESAAGPALIADEEGQKEFWRVRQFIRYASTPDVPASKLSDLSNLSGTCRATVNEIYDLAWSPDGSHIIVGCTDNTARIYDVASGASSNAAHLQPDGLTDGISHDRLLRPCHRRTRPLRSGRCLGPFERVCCHAEQ